MGVVVEAWGRGRGRGSRGGAARGGGAGEAYGQSGSEAFTCRCLVSCILIWLSHLTALPANVINPLPCQQ